MFVRVVIVELSILIPIPVLLPAVAEIVPVFIRFVKDAPDPKATRSIPTAPSLPAVAEIIPLFVRVVIVEFES